MKNKSNRTGTLWQYIIFLGLITSVKLSEPEKTGNCTNVEPDEGALCKFLCKDGQIEVQLFPNEVIISCDNYNKSDYLKWIENLNDNHTAENITEVEIRQCPVLNGSYFEIFNAFKTQPVIKLTLSVSKYNGSDSLTLQPRHFTNLSSIVDLRILNSSIAELPGQLFENTTNLKYLDLSNNSLTRLNENIFKSLHNLTVLKINYNKLNNISSKVFRSLNQLTDLEIGVNAMTTLDDGIFDSLKNLVNLSLSNNTLSAVPSKLFANNSNLKNISLDNAFNKQNFTLPSGLLTNLKSLKSLNLGKNGLKSLPEGLFNDTADLQELYLDGNNLVLSLDQFKKLNNLTILDLSFNNFTNLTANDFNNFNTSINRTVNLSNNQIKTIDLNLTELHKYQINSTRTVVKFEIGGNPIDCDCGALHLAQYFRDESNKSIQIIPDDVVCQEPDNLKNKSLKTVDLKELKCPLVALCPKVAEKNCSCNYRSVDTTVEVNCSFTGISVFPQQLPTYNTSNITNINYYELFFGNNNITSMHGLSNLSALFNITELHLSFNQLENIEDIPHLKALQVLKLDNNHLTYLNEPTIDLLKSTENLTSITLQGNPWICNCDAKYLIEFIRNPGGKINISDDQNIRCEGNGDSIKKLTEDQLCSTSSSRSTFYVFCLAILVLLGAAAIWYYKHKDEVRAWILRNPRLRWLIRKRKVDNDGNYNAFYDQSEENLNFLGAGREREPLIEF